MLDISHVYWLCGAYLAYIAVQTLRDRQHSKRWSTAAFWALLAIAFAFGDAIAPMAMGVMVLILALGVFLPMWELASAAKGRG